MNRIKYLRQENQITQEVLAKLLGLEVAAISKLEIGRVPLKDEYIIKLANFFNVSTDYLLGNSDVRTQGQSIDNVKVFVDAIHAMEAEYNKKQAEARAPRFNNVPVLGRIAAGKPILAQENIEGYLPVDPSIYGFSSTDDLFLLKVVGESMNKKVKNGDYALIHKQDYAENGDIIVALVNGDDEATLKRYKQLNDQFVLLEPMSTDTSIESITIDLKNTSFKIIGKAIGQFGKF